MGLSYRSVIVMHLTRTYRDELEQGHCEVKTSYPYRFRQFKPMLDTSVLGSIDVDGADASPWRGQTTYNWHQQNQ